MTDDATLVRPVRTYLDGHDLKQPGDEPYAVGPYRAQDLMRLGLAEAAPADPAPPTDPAAPAGSEPDASPAKRRRAP